MKTSNNDEVSVINGDANENKKNNDKFYFIDDKFRQELKAEKSGFSLLKVFDDSNSNFNKSKQISRKKHYEEYETLNNIPEHSYNDYSHFDEKNDDKGESDNDIKWWNVNKDPVFFKTDDKRFVNAVEFLLTRDEDYSKNYTTSRNEIKEVIKRKIKKVKAKNMNNSQKVIIKDRNKKRRIRKKKRKN